MRRSLASSAGSRPALWAAFEPGDPVHRGGERDSVPGLCGLDRQPDREVGLASARRAEQHHVAGLAQERPCTQMSDHVPVECGLMIEVDVPQRFAGRESCSYFGGPWLATAAATVSRAMPSCRAIARCDKPSLR
jgi:hypothetical protein